MSRLRPDDGILNVSVYLFVILLIVFGSISSIGTVSGSVENNQNIYSKFPPSDGEFSFPAIQDSKSTSQPDITAQIRREGRYKVEFELTLNVPSTTENVAVFIQNATVTDLNGFQYTEERGTYRWDRSTNSPSIIYEIDIRNWQSREIQGKEYAAGDDWIFAPVPTFLVAWSPERNRDYSYWTPFINPDGGTISVITDGSGFVGKYVLYLGQYTEYSRMANDQRMRLVVAEPATLAEDPDEVVDALENASNYMVGTIHEEITAFALPDPMRKGGRAQTQTGEFWVHADSRLDQPNSGWFHEYMHTRQSYEVSSQMGWFIEASASYHATALPVEQGRLSPDRAVDYLSYGGYDDQVLARPNSWSSNRVPYRKGANVLFALDLEIREATDDEKWLGNVIFQMHQHEGSISYSEFRQIVVDIGGPELGPWLDEYVLTSASPDLSEYYSPSGQRRTEPGGTEAGDENGKPTATAATYTQAQDGEEADDENGIPTVSTVIFVGFIGITIYRYWKRTQESNEVTDISDSAKEYHLNQAKAHRQWARYHLILMGVSLLSVVGILWFWIFVIKWYGHRKASKEHERYYAIFSNQSN